MQPVDDLRCPNPLLPATPNPPQVVAPKRAALADANKRLDGANKKLSGIRGKVKELQDRVADLEESLMRATEDKNNAVAQVCKQNSSWMELFRGSGASLVAGTCSSARHACATAADQHWLLSAAQSLQPHAALTFSATHLAFCISRPRLQAERTANKAALAQRLITGLAGEFARWTQSIQEMAATEGNLVGDVLLSASFVSYAGALWGRDGVAWLLRWNAQTRLARMLCGTLSSGAGAEAIVRASSPSLPHSQYHICRCFQCRAAPRARYGQAGDGEGGGRRWHS